MKSTVSGMVALRRGLFCTSATALSLALPTAAFAQNEAIEEAQPATDIPEEVAAGNEIVVTATKREQTLQDVPVAVTVTTGETIERAQIRDIKDLSSVVPSLRVSQLQSSANTNFFIRGFGNGANNAGIEPSVGLFIDGVYRSRSAAMIGDFPDIERVEVLRGPQSTLFGKNASAGVISIVTQEPQFQFGGNVEATYGNYNAVTVKGVVTGPVTENIALSLAGGLNMRDGYVKDLGAGGRTNERDRWFVRGQGLFENDDLKIRLIGDYSKIDENCCGVVNLRPSPATAAIMHPLVGGMVNDPSQRFDDIVYNNFPSTNEIESYGFSGQIDYSYGPLQLTSITSWRRLDAVTNQDSDFTSADLLSRNFQDLRIDTFTQELRIASDLDGPLNFLLGGFYFHEDIDQTNQILLGSDFRNYADLLIRGQSGGAFTLAQVEQLMSGSAGLLPPGTPGVPTPPYVGRFFGPGTGMNEAYTLKDESFSIFGEVDFEVTDGLTLTAGINYTKDKKRYETNVVSDELFSSLVLSDFVAPATGILISQQVGGILGVPGGFATPAQIGAFAQAQPAAFAQISQGSAAAAGQLTSLSALQFLPPFLNVPNAVEDNRLSDDDLSYTLRLSYDVSDTINVYASYATGYKPGSINLSRDSRPFPEDRAAIQSAGLAVPNLTYTSRFAGSEDSTVIEAGLKANWGVVSANLAVFQQEIEGFQSNIFTGTGFVLTNAGKQSTFGIEFEGMAKPIEELTLNLAVTYLDPKFDDFEISAFGDLSGTTPAGVPPISATFGFTWDQPIGDGEDRIILRSDFHYEAAYQPVEGLPGFLMRGPDGQFTPQSVANALQIAREFKRDVSELNASLTYAMGNGLELSVWGRNILDDSYIIQVFDSPAQQASISGYPSQPRTYGVAARFRW
jgi:iron complex outermembrane recepter protein